MITPFLASESANNNFKPYYSADQLRRHSDHIGVNIYGIFHLAELICFVILVHKFKYENFVIFKKTWSSHENQGHD